MAYNDQWVKEPFRHPPLSARTKVFEMYQKKINESHHNDLMCYIDAFVLYNNTMISYNMLEAARKANVKRFFFASSACVYPEYRQLNEDIGFHRGSLYH